MNLPKRPGNYLRKPKNEGPRTFRCECGTDFAAANHSQANRIGCPECRRKNATEAEHVRQSPPEAKYARIFSVLIPSHSNRCAA
jgi:hypothetical protein